MLPSGDLTPLRDATVDVSEPLSKQIIENKTAGYFRGISGKLQQILPFTDPQLNLGKATFCHLSYFKIIIIRNY